MNQTYNTFGFVEINDFTQCIAQSFIGTSHWPFGSIHFHPLSKSGNGWPDFFFFLAVGKAKGRCNLQDSWALPAQIAALQFLDVEDPVPVAGVDRPRNASMKVDMKDFRGSMFKTHDMIMRGIVTEISATWGLLTCTYIAQCTGLDISPP